MTSTLFSSSSFQCHGGGGSGCCQKNNMPVIVNCGGQGGGGCQPGYGCGRYGCARVKSFGALTKRVVSLAVSNMRKRAECTPYAS